MIWWIIAGVVGYLLVLLVAIGLARVASISDDAMYDWVPEPREDRTEP